jgi:hypothetical protein
LGPFPLLRLKQVGLFSENCPKMIRAIRALFPVGQDDPEGERGLMSCIRRWQGLPAPCGASTTRADQVLRP